MDLFILPILLLAGVLSTGWLAIAAIVISVISTVYSFTVAQKAAKSSQDGILITKHDNNAGLPVVYGQRTIGGVKVWKNVSKNTFEAAPGRVVFGQGDPTDGVGVDWKPYTFLDRVDVLCEGPIHSLTDIIVDSETYNAPRFRERNQAIYRGIFMDGSDGQNAITELCAHYPEWHTTSVGTKVAYVNSRFRSGHYEDDGYDSYYQGEPNCEYVVKGKLIWDPRKDVNYGGTGTHDLNDESTWEWSDNPALCLMDYLTQPYGRNLHHGELDLSTFVDAANSCDELVAIPQRLENNTGGNVIGYDPLTGEWIDVSTGEPMPHYRPDQVGINQKRLTCNAVINPDESVLDNVKTLLQSMRGSLPYSNGKYGLVLEAPRGPAMSVDINDIIGGITFGNGERSKRYNRVTVVFPNKNKRYKEDRVAWPKLGSDTFADFLEADNGEELFYEVQLDAITDYYQAEDIAEFICRDSRQQLQAEFKMKSKGMLLQPGDVIEVDHPTPGWTAKEFRVRQIAINNDHTVSLSLQEYNDSIYDWANTSNEPDTPDVNLPTNNQTLYPVTDLQALISSKESAKGIPQGFVELSWLPPEGSVPREYITRVIGVEDPSIKFELITSPTLDTATERAGSSFTVPKDDMDYNVTVSYMTSKSRLGPATGGSITIPQYVTQIEQELDNIESEAGEILENEDGSGGFQPADLTDLAVYYKDQGIEIDQDIADLTNSLDQSVTDLNADMTVLQNQLNDITSGTADVYVQPEPPVPGVSGVPNPIPTNTRWYDSDDNNAPYIWDGTSWVSIKDGDIAQNSADIVSLQSGLTTAQGDITANTTAVGVLDTTVTNLDGVVTAQSADITALESTVNDSSTGVAANAAAVSTLTTSVTQNEGDITSISTDLTELSTTVNDPVTGVDATSTAVSALDTRVTTAEGTITSQSSDITTLQSDLAVAEADIDANASATSGLSTRVETVENDIDAINVVSEDVINLSADLDYRQNIEPEGTNRPGSSNDIDLEDGTGPLGLENDLSQIVKASSDAAYRLATDIKAAEGSLVIQSQQLVTLDSTLTDAQGDILANANAVQGLTTTVTLQGDDLTALSEDLTVLEASLDATDGLVAGNATAIDSLSAEVTQIDGVVTSSASDITQLQADLSDADANIIANAAAHQELVTTVSAIDGELTAVSQDVTLLTSDLAATDALVGGNASALSALQTEVTQIDGEVAAQASDITDLQVDLTDAEGDIAANAAATQSLTVRVTENEGGITSVSSDITSLESRVDTAESNISGNATALSGLNTTVTQQGESIDSQASQITDLTSDIADADAGIAANAAATSALTTRVASTETGLASQASDITTLSADLSDLDDVVDGVQLDVTANAQATTALTTRVASNEGSISSVSQDVTTLSGTITALDSDVAANASAVSGLATRVTTAEGTISSQSSDITTLTSDLSDLSGEVDATVTAQQGLTTKVTQTEEDVAALEARYYVHLDVNNHVAGIELDNDGTTSSFTVVANEFKVYNSNYGTDIAPFQVTGSGISMTGNVSINGDLIVNGSISQNELGGGCVGSDEIIDGSVGANELVISAGDGVTGERMYFNGDDNRIEIFDSNNVVRVMLGNLN